MELEDFDSVEIDKDTLGGTPRLRGTRIPLWQVLDHFVVGDFSPVEYAKAYEIDVELVEQFFMELRNMLDKWEKEHNVYTESRSKEWLKSAKEQREASLDRISKLKEEIQPLVGTRIHNTNGLHRPQRFGEMCLVVAEDRSKNWPLALNVQGEDGHIATILIYRPVENGIEARTIPGTSLNLGSGSGLRNALKGYLTPRESLHPEIGNKSWGNAYGTLDLEDAIEMSLEAARTLCGLDAIERSLNNSDS